MLKIAFWMFFIFFSNFAYAQFDVTSDIGYESSVNFRDQKPEIGRPFWLLKLADSFDSNYMPKNFVASLRMRQNFVNRENVNDNGLEFSGREFFGEWISDSWNFKLGLQSISWGETFGVSVSDIVNSRDYSESLLSSLEETRIPDWSLNYQFFLDNISTQFIWTPLPARPILPDYYQNIEVRNSVQHVSAKDSEYGTRIGYLFSSGLDFKVIYFRHWNRFPTYNFYSTDYEKYFENSSHIVDTSGFSYSYAFEKIVLRGDVVFNKNSPVNTELSQEPKFSNQQQAILGTDYTSLDGLTLGLQYHNEYWDKKALHHETKNLRQWLSFQIVKSLLNEIFEIKTFVFTGLDNTDLWAKPELSWHFSTTGSLLFAVDLVDGRKDDYFAKIKDEDRFWTKIVFKL